MTEPKKDGELSFAEQQTALADREAKLAEREKAIEKAARDSRHADHVSFAEGMIGKVTLAPAGKNLLVGLLDQLGEIPEVVSFGEAEADKMTPVAALKKLLEGAAPLVSLGEFAKAEKGAGKPLASFAAPAGYDVDPDRAELFARARALQDADPKLAWMDAVRRAEVA